MGGLPTGTVNGFTVHPSNPKLMYVAMREGVFRSQDGGSRWAAVAGGPNEYANRGDISVVRIESDGQQKRYKFNYNDVVQGKNMQQNIELKPGDTIVVRD